MRSSRRLRFTGVIPTLSAVRKFPNWTYALDEETVPGQDETTLRPDDDQRHISFATVCTRASAACAGGGRLVALLRGDGELHKSARNVERLYLYEDSHVAELEFISKWWWPIDEGRTKYYYDFDVFPLRVTSDLPTAKRGTRLCLTLMPNGEVRLGTRPDVRPLRLPPLLRPGDLPPVPRDYLVGANHARIYSVRRGRKRCVGSSEVTIERRPRSRALRLRSRYDREDTDLRVREDLLMDETTLAAIRLRTTVNGETRLHNFGSGGHAHLRVPAFADHLSLIRSIPLTKGFTAIVPVFFSLGAVVRNCLVRVRGPESAPGHPRSSAWRISFDFGGPFYPDVWIDQSTRTLLASRTPGVEHELLQIFRIGSGEQPGT